MKVAGIDECGMGAVAGPIVVVGVYAEDHELPKGVRDSKLIRDGAEIDRLAQEIVARNKYRFIVRDARYINAHGLASAWTSAVVTVAKLLVDVGAKRILLDGARLPSVGQKPVEIRERCDPVIAKITPVPHGDRLHKKISAASIMAKWVRDHWMFEMAGEQGLEDYGFARHKGYPTSEHAAALRLYGPSREHRLEAAWKVMGGRGPCPWLRGLRRPSGERA